MITMKDSQMFTSDNISELYLFLINKLINEGKIFSKNGLLIKELHPCLICLENPRDRFISVKERHLNPAFMAAEALWIVSGCDDDWLTKYNGNIKKYIDGPKMVGAPGPRLRNWRGDTDQFRAVKDALQTNPESQQATMVIFDPSIDLSGHKFVPCANMFRFMIRDGKLDMIAIMRANDIWLGFPYDVFVYTLIQELMAGFIGVEVGKYYHFLDVLRLYENNWEDVEKIDCINNGQATGIRYQNAYLSWNDFDCIVNELVEYAQEPNKSLPQGLTHFWKNMVLTMGSYAFYKLKDYETSYMLKGQITNEFKWLLEDWFSYLECKRMKKHCGRNSYILGDKNKFQLT